jgi:hypothetical protein
MKCSILCAWLSVSLSLIASRGQAQLNQCPTASNQLVTVPENVSLFVRGSGTIVVFDVTNAFRLNASDAQGDPLQVQVAGFPAHGVLFKCSPNPDGNGDTCVNFPGGITDAGPAPRLLYVPDIRYRGTDSFTYTVNDGQCTSAVAAVAIAIAQVNHAPLPATRIEQLRIISGLGDVVIAPGGGPSHVKVDASSTTDDGPSPLRFEFSAQNATGQQALADGVVCLEFPEGTRFSLVQVYVMDGAGATGFRQDFFNIHTPGEVIDALLGLTQGEFLGIRSQRPYRAPLEAAKRAFVSGNTDDAIAELEAFQQQVATRLARKQPGGAAWWIDTAQWIIDSVTTDYCL